MCYLISFLLTISVKDTSHWKYIKTLLDTSNHKEYLMVVKAVHRSKFSEVVLSNLDLITYLKRRNIVISDSLITEIALGRYFYQLEPDSRIYNGVTNNKKINAIKKKGKIFFMDYFFDSNGNLKSSLAHDYLGQVVKILFDWNIFVSENEFSFLYCDYRGNVLN